MKILKKLEKKYKNFFKNKTFQKELKKYKDSIYFKEKSQTKYRSKRNKFKLFEKRLQFENTFTQIKWLNLYYFIIWFVLILSSLYIVLFSDYFSVKNIDIIKNDSWVNINLAYKSVEDIRYSPLIFTDKKEIKQKILSFQPNISNVEISKILPNNLKIILTSFDKLFYFENDWKKYEILENWSVIPTSTIQKENIIKIKWLSLYWFIDYKIIFDWATLKSIFNALNYLKENNSFVQVKELTYYLKEYEFHILTQDNITILFDLTKDIKPQVEKLDIFYKNYQNQIKAWITYIDLRIEDKLIYCPEDKYKICKNNLDSVYWK